MRSWLKIALLLSLILFGAPLKALPELDISGRDFVQQGPVAIEGDWMFFWKRYFTPDEIRSLRFLHEKSMILHAPGGLWRQLPEPVETLGWATYVMKIKGLDTRKKPLALQMGQFMGTHQTWFYWPQSDRLELMGSSGVNSTNEADFVPQYKKLVADLPEIDDSEAWVIIAVSSYIIDGSMPASPSLHDRELMHREERHHEWEIFLIVGMFGMLMLTNLALYLLRREDKPSLIMTAFAGLLLLRYMGTEGLAFEFFPEPNRAFSLFYMYSLAGVLSFCMCTYFEFLYHSFPGYLRRRNINIGWSLTVLVQVLGLIWTKEWMSLALFLWVFLFPLAIWNFWGLVLAYRQGVKSSLFALIGIGLFFAAVFLDVLVYMNWIAFRYTGQYGMIGFVFMQSLVVAYNFALAFRTAERLSLHLRHEVDQQTLRLRLQKEKLEEQKRELVLAHDSLREADAQKTRFFRSISHELRTPLTLILGSLPAAERSQTEKRSLEVVRRNASRLFRLVNQLLDFQKVALSQTRLRLEEIDLLRFLQGVAPYFSSACHEKKIRFEMLLPSDADPKFSIMAQADALEKIIFNYLANALKFTSTGGNITIELASVQGQARITVSDDGPGIAPSEQDKLFKLFSQIEGPHQKEQQGTGLGLALVKELAQHMNGEVGVRSQQGTGASFWVEFPLISAQEFTDLLILDADLDAWDETLNILRDRGWRGRVKQTTDAVEAERILNTHQLSVFLCAAHFAAEQPILLRIAARSKYCWKVLIGDPSHPEWRNLQLEGREAWFERPLGEDFWALLLDRMETSRDSEKPILDLIYLEDDPLMQQEFHTALGTYTLLEQVKVISRGTELRALFKEFRVRVVVADARLEDERGTDLLAFVKQVSPDTFRILLTGETSQEILGAGITEAQAHYIIYKPADLEKEVKVIEGYVARSAIQPALLKDQKAAGSKEWQLAGLDSELLVDTKLGIVSPKPEQAKATILVVDDVSDMRAMISAILQSYEFHVLHAAHGLQALEMLQNMPTGIDIIVTDWLMPQLNGPDLIARLRGIEELASIPTILLTAKTDTESKAYGTMIGASAYIGKPFDEMELLSTVDNLLDLKKRERKIEELNRFIATHVLQRFLPPDLVEDLVAGKARFDDAAQLRIVTVLFADLCGFTQWTERLGPERISSILNSFLVRMTDVIFSQGGTIDKFMGDGILVIFGAPRAMEASVQVEAAARCAAHMHEALDGLNRVWHETEGMIFQMRIGIHHGPAVVGSFGGDRRSDYTAVGNTVNIASRVETCAQPGETLVTPAVTDFLKSQLWENAGAFKLKGIEGEMELFRLVDDDQVDQGAA